MFEIMIYKQNILVPQGVRCVLIHCKLNGLEILNIAEFLKISSCILNPTFYVKYNMKMIRSKLALFKTS
jgi:hypothetical protein